MAGNGDYSEHDSGASPHMSSFRHAALFVMTRCPECNSGRNRIGDSPPCSSEETVRHGRLTVEVTAYVSLPRSSDVSLVLPC